VAPLAAHDQQDALVGGLGAPDGCLEILLWIPPGIVGALARRRRERQQQEKTGRARKRHRQPCR
jgi:hypothetical protein